ncbi:MAG: PhzF family phenazine biosynthesis protein [Sedimenticola sp.]
MPKTIPLIQVNTFTDKPFTGNPAAACLLEQKMDATWMQLLKASPLQS